MVKRHAVTMCLHELISWECVCHRMQCIDQSVQYQAFFHFLTLLDARVMHATASNLRFSSGWFTMSHKGSP